MRVNRGVALLDNMLCVGTLDGRLVALDAKSGAVRWDKVVGDNKTGHSITVAPQHVAIAAGRAVFVFGLGN